MDIPALKYKSKSYPIEFQGKVPKVFKMLETQYGGMATLFKGKEYEAFTDSNGTVSAIVRNCIPIGVDKEKIEVVEWYYSGNYSQCDWNPRDDGPSEFLLGNYRDLKPQPTNGCQNEAVWCVGSKEVWHLCNECAKLPRFKRFRSKHKLPKQGRVI